MDIEELRLVYEVGMKGFPPRKPEQPIFYPALNLEYANEIAKRWNAESQSASGYVARFNLDDKYGARFEPQKVGGSHHVELWVPSEELSRFNEHILPPIVIVSAHFGQSEGSDHLRGQTIAWIALKNPLFSPEKHPLCCV